MGAARRSFFPTSSEIQSSSSGCTAPRVRSLTAQRRVQEKGRHEGSPPSSPFRPQSEEGPGPKPAYNIGSPAWGKTPKTSRSCAPGVFRRPLAPRALPSSSMARSRSRWPLRALPAPRLRLPGLPNPQPAGASPKANSHGGGR